MGIDVLRAYSGTDVIAHLQGAMLRSKKLPSLLLLMDGCIASTEIDGAAMVNGNATWRSKSATDLRRARRRRGPIHCLPEAAGRRDNAT